ncbi:acyl carrier protein [Streptomyces tateyamensis]|uniref:Acyl carrier protein n=1 Tax=Streptomyces tateyamensis TaxID=565073 RepID=A0A2V4NYF6_9ACTN|nr:acyl carrier protein [Streptomyces tateyamensis]PYC68197.1 acyl carrier protein [Streptomyces tateyamensis]
MNTVDDFLALLRDELGMPVSTEDLPRGLDEVPGWDSVHLIWLLSALEQRLGRPVSLARILEAPTLAEIYQVALAG